MVCTTCSEVDALEDWEEFIQKTAEKINIRVAQDLAPFTQRLVESILIGLEPTIREFVAHQKGHLVGTEKSKICEEDSASEHLEDEVEQLEVVQVDRDFFYANDMPPQSPPVEPAEAQDDLYLTKPLGTFPCDIVFVTLRPEYHKARHASSQLKLSVALSKNVVEHLKLRVFGNISGTKTMLTRDINRDIYLYNDPKSSKPQWKNMPADFVSISRSVDPTHDLKEIKFTRTLKIMEESSCTNPTDGDVVKRQSSQEQDREADNGIPIEESGDHFQMDIKEDIPARKEENIEDEKIDQSMNDGQLCPSYPVAKLPEPDPLLTSLSTTDVRDGGIRMRSHILESGSGLRKSFWARSKSQRHELPHESLYLQELHRPSVYFSRHASRELSDEVNTLTGHVAGGLVENTTKAHFLEQTASIHDLPLDDDVESNMSVGDSDEELSIYWEFV